jgi:hypothetical protein
MSIGWVGGWVIIEDSCYALAGHSARTPEEAFLAIETLLPTGSGKFLELWAPQGASRPGWTHLVEMPPAKGA